MLNFVHYCHLYNTLELVCWTELQLKSIKKKKKKQQQQKREQKPKPYSLCFNRDGGTADAEI